MNFKTRFGDLPLNEPFLYNGILYTKSSDSEGLSQRLGFFTINPDEIVSTAMYVETSAATVGVIRFALAWAVVMGAIYLIGEFCI
jgi:hypothetical protein